MDEDTRDESQIVSDLMAQIVCFDCEPSVYDVTVKRSSHTSGFSAYVQFRTYIKGSTDSISTHGDTAAGALQALFNELTARYGKCPHCGEYRHRRVVAALGEP